jgi:DNA-binding GntR family transcriptional regulator
MDSLSTVSAVLKSERERLVRSGTAERVTEILREQVTSGLFVPGTRLSEEAIGEALGVSRNTLREAFRLLGHEHLVVHELNRGVFVRVLTAADVTDLYLLRQIIEGSALKMAGGDPAVDLGKLTRVVEDADSAAADDLWLEVATLDLQFHQEIVALARSPRLDEIMRRLLAELRLAFHVMSGSLSSLREFHEPYLLRNRKLTTLLEKKRFNQAAQELRAYLDDAHAQLVVALNGSPSGIAAEASASGEGRANRNR